MTYVTNKFYLNCLNQNQTVIIWCRQGLGDHIIAAGAINQISQRVDKAYVLCRTSHYTSICHMFKHCPNIIVLDHQEFTNTAGSDPNRQQLEHIQQALGASYILPIMQEWYFVSSAWMQGAYEQYGLDYQSRWQCWPYIEATPRGSEILQYLQNLHKNYILLHDYSSECEKYDIDLSVSQQGNCMPWVRIMPDCVPHLHSDNIFDWVPTLLHAQEIHVVTSSPMHLLEQLQHQINGPVYFHHKRDHTRIDLARDLSTHHKWILIDYDQKQFR